MSFEEAFRQRMIFEASCTLDVARFAEATAPYLADESEGVDVTGPFAELAGPVLSRYGLYERRDADAVLIMFIENLIKTKINE